MNTILIVDDEPNYLIVISELLKEEGFETITAENGQKALEIIRGTDLDLIITDMKMPGMDGFVLLKETKAFNEHLPVIMITAFGEVEKAVQAMRSGAFTYLTKPFNNDELVASIRKAIEHYALAKENCRLRDEMQARFHFSNIIGKNKTMQQIYTLIGKVAPTPATVLVSGESGTGKELVAKALHFNSPREKGPFISLNCAAMPESLLESELFGHEKGAFTGAVSMRKGKFEAADNGTIFLDEIGDMPLLLQAKMLRVLQEKSFERVGGNKTIYSDVRIIAATNRDLKEEVDENRFREDLYYRLNVVHIHLPPLRERVDDIPMLTSHFVKKYAKQFGQPNLTMVPEALRFLSSLPWEGNVRELENTIERAVILCNGGIIRVEDLQPGMPGENKPPMQLDFDLDQFIPGNASLPDILNFIEEKMVKRALEQSEFIQTKAARQLGITKSLLQYKMRKFGITKKE
jgi:two-component system NtrC family response regulator